MRSTVIRYYRAHGLGNDYIVLDFSQSAVKPLPAVIRRICDRHEGIGGDGALVQRESSQADFGVQIFNPDGSEAEKSGNGVRIFARYLFDEGLLHLKGTLQTAGGLVELTVHPTGGAPELEADMGPPRFDTQQIPVRTHLPTLIEQPVPLHPDMPVQLSRPAQPPFAPQTEPTRAHPAAPSDQEVIGTAVSMGNPHFVCFLPEGYPAAQPQDVPLDRVGPALEHHPWFPNRSNIQFARVLSRERVRVRIWERGAGETRASGSSACAVVAAGIRTGRLDPQVTVEMAGGLLQVRQDERGHIFQRGPVQLISRGELSQELESELSLLE